MGTTRQIFTGDKSQLEAAYRDLAREVVRLETQVQRLSTTSQRGNQAAVASQRESNQLVSAGVRQVGALAASYVSVHAAIAAVNEQTREQLALQQQFATKQISVADSQAGLITALAGVPTQERLKFIQEMDRIARESKFPDRATFNLAAQRTLSAAGGDLPAVIDAMRASSLITRHVPEELPDTATAAVLLRQSTGVEDARRNLGFLIDVGARSPMPDLKATVRNATQAVTSASLTVQGDRERAAIEAGALFSALTTVAPDVRGDQGATATASFAIQLRDFFEKGKEITVGGRKYRIRPAEDPGTIEGRVAFLQQNADQARRFQEDLNIERKFRIPVEQLLKPGGLTSRLFTENLRELSLDRREFETLEQDLRTLTPELRLADVHRSALTTAEENELARKPEALAAEARRIRDEALERTRRFSALGPVASPIERLGALIEDTVQSPEAVIPQAIYSLEQRRRSIRGRRNFLDPSQPRQFTAEESLAREFLADQIRELQRLIEQQRQHSERSANALERLDARDAARDARQPTAAPAAVLEQGRHRER